MMDFLGRHHLAIIWVLLILVISIITGVFFHYYGNPFIQDFISSGLSTLLGAIVGVPIAIWIATHQEGQTAKRKNQKIIAVLRRELIYNLEILSDFENSLAGDGIVTVVVRDETWKAFSDAGELHWIKDLDLLDNIASIYFDLKTINIASGRYHDLHLGRSIAGMDAQQEELKIRIANAIRRINRLLAKIPSDNQGD